MNKSRHNAVMNSLLANCKQSDREIAKHAKVSQPTVTRIRQRLEKAGIIKGYQAIPDYTKIGFAFGAITLGELAPEASLKSLFSTDAIIMHAPTMSNADQNFIIITMHRTIEDHDLFMQRIKAVTVEGTVTSALFNTAGLELRPVQVQEKST